MLSMRCGAKDIFRAVESFFRMAYTSKFVPDARSIFLFFYISTAYNRFGDPKDDCTQSSFESEILFWGWGGSITLFILLC